MNITYRREPVPWLLLIFSLPSKRTSERVRIWRKLQKYGTLALRNSGYVLPNTPANQERLEWLPGSRTAGEGSGRTARMHIRPRTTHIAQWNGRGSRALGRTRQDPGRREAKHDDVFELLGER